MTTNLELYDTLRKHLHEEAARVIAEAIPSTDRLATKSDMLLLKADLESVRGELKANLESVRGDLTAAMHRMEAATYRWMLTFFATLFLGMGGMILTIVLKG